MTVATPVQSRPRPIPEAPDRPAPSKRTALVAVGVGLTATALAAAGVVHDLTGSDVLADHLRDTYAPHGVTPPEEGVVAAYLLTVAGLGIVGWASALWAVARRRRWARPVSTVLFVLGSLVALAHLTVSEYGSTILPSSFGLVGVLICIPGLVAVVQLWRAPRAA